jgi:hypothetical protein
MQANAMAGQLRNCETFALAIGWSAAHFDLERQPGRNLLDLKLDFG